MTSDLCALAAGDLAGWSGLVPFPPAAAPDCLGPVVAEGMRRLGTELAAYRDHLAPDGTATRLVSGDDGLVRLVETTPAEPLTPPGDEPDLVLRLPFAAYLDDPALDTYGSALADRVYARRGLAVVVTETGAAVRLRGFAPTTAEAYVAALRTYPPVEFG